ncbi:hypothetical protein ADUPG1_001675 [Aduncisulcus paluster]|uniref:Uncharacterized protein n=1 Tax=Aduncisulcus paluster TaxID=2918883 RepID=A0ABQ5KII4_9EUKA|nr:hypothetical protein ADUPG1_001675 [Aduncisulcus paluster]
MFSSEEKVSKTSLSSIEEGIVVSDGKKEPEGDENAGKTDILTMDEIKLENTDIGDKYADGIVKKEEKEEEKEEKEEEKDPVELSSSEHPKHEASQISITKMVENDRNQDIYELFFDFATLRYPLVSKLEFPCIKVENIVINILSGSINCDIKEHGVDEIKLELKRMLDDVKGVFSSL